MRKTKPTYLIFLPILLLGIAGYFAIDQNPRGISRTTTPTLAASASEMLTHESI